LARKRSVATNRTLPPRPTTARERNAARNDPETANPTTPTDMARRPTAATRRLPSRSASRPEGSCSAA